MKKIIFLILIIAFAAGVSFAGTKGGGIETDAVSRYEQERREYEEIYFDHRNSENGEWETAYKRVIARYKEFLKKHKNSEFADDAKLRIAEFYSLLFQKEKARPYLDDIIANHPSAEAYSIKKGMNGGNKTAAWALYWRAAWFGPKKGRLAEQKDLLAILEKYPQSEDVVYQVLILFPDETKIKLIKNFGLNPKFYETLKLKAE